MIIFYFTNRYCFCFVLLFSVDYLNWIFITH